MFNLVTLADPRNPDSLTERNIQGVAEAARNSGYKVFSLGIDADLERFPESMDGPTIFNGYIPEDFTLIHTAIESKGGSMINSAEMSERLMSFLEWYPRIEDLTAKSVVVNGLDDEKGIQAALELRMPLFVKGEIKSNKEAGLESCLASSREDIIEHLRYAEDRPRTWRGKIITREFLDLRSQERATGFPVHREYRVFLIGSEVVGKGFYWRDSDSFGLLDANENQDINDLAREAQKRLDTNLTIVDVGQLKNGEWRIIEVGDPQFCTFTHMSALSFFQRLQDLAKDIV